MVEEDKQQVGQEDELLKALRDLFDDKQYFSIGFLANLFDKKKQVIEEIIKEKPDVLALSVFSDNYQWSLDLVRRVKEKHKNLLTKLLEIAKIKNLSSKDFRRYGSARSLYNFKIDNTY